MLHMPIKKLSLQDMPIRRKLLTVTLLVALLVLLVSLLGFQVVSAQYNRMIYTQTASSLAVISDKVVSRLNNLIETSLYIAVNQEFQRNLISINEKPSTAAQAVSRSQISGLLYRTFHNDIITITVFPKNANPIVLGMNSLPEAPEVYQRAQTLAAKAEGAAVLLPTGRSDGSILLVREIRNVKEPFLETIGLLMLRVNLGEIVESSVETLLSNEYTLSISQNEELLYPYMDGSTTASLPTFGNGLPYSIQRWQGEMFFLSRSQLRSSRYNWNFVLGIPYNDVFRSLVGVNLLFVLCLLMAVLLAMLLSRRLLDSINRDVSLLSAKMQQVRKGNLSPYQNPATLGRDELGTLNWHFDEMTADFKKVIEDNYIKELLLTQTQLKALEQQMNPHFLYNSLESINWFARSGDGKNVSAIAQALGRLLRSTLSEDQDCIPLRQELSILESYLSIQRIRFPDTLRVELVVDEAALELQIPKMSIQPLAENAIIHALEENIGECHISIHAALQDQLLQVTVKNDGSEIDVDILAKLKERQVEPKGHGIGLINIDSRIKLLFGQAYGLQLSNCGNLAVVSFQIPARTASVDDKAAPQSL